ncbi:MAG: hypothetical protein ACD_58C00145G0001 [uncultured bacterium]|nr:MAG: hypothetical protein ACD_58C00145G0001 [uncultured bacterium]
MRKNELSNGYYYHIMNKSIAGYTIFNSDFGCIRFINTLTYYLKDNPDLSYAHFLKLSAVDQSIFLNKHNAKDGIVDILAYCLMPTHFHLILKQLVNKGVSRYVANILNSYTRYFNIKHNRKGPLWQGKFKNVLVESDEQLIHLTRYIHLNPVTSNLVDDPKDWEFSSYKEYINETDSKLCNFDILDIKQGAYKRFVLSQKNYQRELHLIKKQIIE